MRNQSMHYVIPTPMLLNVPMVNMVISSTAEIDFAEVPTLCAPSEGLYLRRLHNKPI